MPSKRKIDSISEEVTPSNNDQVHILQCIEGSSNKFYEITLSRNKVISRYGKTGTLGASTSKEFSTYTDALAYVAGLLSEKLKKGYFATDSQDRTSDAVKSEKAGLKSNISDCHAQTMHKKGVFDCDGERDIKYLECNEGSSSKFYEIIREGDTVTIRYGRIGTDGVHSEKKFGGDDSAAITFVNKTLREKESKGYALVLSEPAAVIVDSSETGTASNDTRDSSRHTKAASSVFSAAPSVAPAKVNAISTTAPSTTAGAVKQDKSAASSDNMLHYLECTEGSSRKFYEITRSGDNVTIRYGRLGTDGVSSEKTFGGDVAAAVKFAEKTVHEKEKKGYTLRAKPDADDIAVGGGAVSAEPHVEMQSSGNLATDLDNGMRVFIKGSSALPYTLKKFNGGYSCSCQGWAMQVHVKGAQATSCKHLKLVRGVEAEAERCQAFAGVKTSSAKKNTSIPGSISLAQQWSASIDPTGYIMSEKLDGMRAYWCGKKLWTRSGLPIIAPDWFVAALPKDLVLDGELFLGRQQFDACMSIARRTDASDEWEQLRYVVFDAPHVKGGVATRLKHAAEVYMAVTGASSFTSATAPAAPQVTKGGQVSLNAASAAVAEGVYWVLHPHTECTGMEHLLEELARVEAQGGEGLMLRSATASHRGGRSSDLLKVKSFHDDEALVTAHEDGNGKYQGMVGSLVCVSRTGARFKVGSGLTDAMRAPRAAPAQGTVITFKYFELTKDGIPRFPTFLRVRPDVNKSEFPSNY